MTEQNGSGLGRHGGARPIRSYVRRAGRLTRAQSRALETLWPRFGADMSAAADLDALFARSAPRVLEVGFGMGDALAAMARARPEHDFLGIDVHEPGIGRLLTLLDRLQLGNVRIVRGDAMELLERHLAAASLAEILVFFPDPWPKKRHHKRRLVQAPFLALCARALGPGGLLHLATDWEPYAEAMLELLESSPAFENLHPGSRYAPHAGGRPETKFERRGGRLGHRIRDLRFARR